MVALALFALFSPAQAAEFYVDPVTGHPDGDGSADNPWRTLQEVIEAQSFTTQQWDSAPYEEGVSTLIPNQTGPIQPGDTVWLREGFHGEVNIQEAYLESPITIAAAPGATPTASQVRIRSASNWTLRGLTVSPSFTEPYDSDSMVEIRNHSWTGPVHDLTIEEITLFSVEDITGWTAEDWNAYAATGLFVDGTRITVRENNLKNVNFGITVLASDSLVEHNRIENFAGDGLRGLGDYTVFQYNTVMNSYAVNDNHDDGFQSWSVGPDGVGTGEVVGVVLRGNVFINYTDPDQPLRGALQGIGCFDGMFVDWVVENNVVAVDHWHGITLMGARNVRVVNNTVVDLNSDSPGPPWISVTHHKNGTEPTDSLVRNNLSTAYKSHETVEEDSNLTVDEPSEHFVAYPYDLRLLASSPAIDAGNESLAPEQDADEKPRPIGVQVDIGAYEFGEVEIDTDTGSDGETDSETGSTADTTAGKEGCGCTAQSAGPGWALVFLGILPLWRSRSRGAWRPLRRGARPSAIRKKKTQA